MKILIPEKNIILDSDLVEVSYPTWDWFWFSVPVFILGKKEENKIYKINVHPEVKDKFDFVNELEKMNVGDIKPVSSTIISEMIIRIVADYIVNDKNLEKEDQIHLSTSDISYGENHLKIDEYIKLLDLNLEGKIKIIS